MIKDVRFVDPRTLLTPTSRRVGADPVKLQRQIAKFGNSTLGMRLILVYERVDGQLVIWDGVTRATRVALLAPGTVVKVEVIGRLSAKYQITPSLGDILP